MKFDAQNSSIGGPNKPTSSLDTRAMNLAIENAKKAWTLDEVPVGAVIFQERDPATGAVLAEPVLLAAAHNTRETEANPAGHAELTAIIEAAKKLQAWRLSGCTLYVTLEPCLMCAGAIILSRVDRVVYGTPDPKAGAVESLYKVLEDSRLNHRPTVSSGVLADECSRLLKDFFAGKRAKGKSAP